MPVFILFLWCPAAESELGCYIYGRKGCCGGPCALWLLINARNAPLKTYPGGFFLVKFYIAFLPPLHRR